MGRSENAEAYRLYLQAQFFRDQLSKDRTAKGIEFFVQALQMDPGYALAWAGLSRAYSDQAGQNWVPRAEGYAKARAAAERALKLEPTLPEAHTALGWVQSSCDWDWKAADASFQRALELAPGSALAINAAATLAGNVGRLHEAVDLFKRATTMDPLNATIHRNLGLYALAADIPEVAESALNEALLLNPSGGLTNCWCALLRLAQGRKDEAFEAATRETNEVFRLVVTAVVEHARGNFTESDAALATLIEKCGEFSAYQVAGVYAYRNEPDSAFQWLEKTYAQRDPGVTYVKMDPLMRGLRTDPRWHPFIEKLGLAG